MQKIEETQIGLTLYWDLAFKQAGKPIVIIKYPTEGAYCSTVGIYAVATYNAWSDTLQDYEDCWSLEDAKEIRWNRSGSHCTDSSPVESRISTHSEFAKGLMEDIGC